MLWQPLIHEMAKVKGPCHAHRWAFLKQCAAVKHTQQGAFVTKELCVWEVWLLVSSWYRISH